MHKEKLEAENHPWRAFQPLKSLEIGKDFPRIGAIHCASHLEEESKREREERHRDRRSPSLQPRLCSCFLSQVLCVFPAAVNLADFSIDRACTRDCIRRLRQDERELLAVRRVAPYVERGKRAELLWSSKADYQGYFNEQIDHARTHSNKCLFNWKSDGDDTRGGSYPVCRSCDRALYALAMDTFRPLFIPRCLVQGNTVMYTGLQAKLSQRTSSQLDKLEDS